MFDNSAFNQARMEAEITDTELADFIGESRKALWDITLGRAPVTLGHWVALRATMKAKGRDVPMCGAPTGRGHVKGPNIQNIPIRTEEASRVRRLLVVFLGKSK
jgi:hypothetical protein